jgi:pyruvate, water dikinase
MLFKNIFKYWTRQLFSPDIVLQDKYASFKSLLGHDKRAHELMADLEEIYYHQVVVDFKAVEDKYNDFSTCVRAIVEDLKKICPTRYPDLMAYYKRFDDYTRFLLSPKKIESSPPFVIPISEISKNDKIPVGGKAMHLAMARQQTAIPSPDGFVITANAFNAIIAVNALRHHIDTKLAGLDIDSAIALNAVSRELTDLVRNAAIPSEIENAVIDTVGAMWPDGMQDVRFALRSSAVSEDSRASFAGQYRTVLHVSYDNIFDAYRQVIASKYSPEAIYYRISFGLTDIETPMAVLCMEMIDAKTGGIMYTRDLENPESDQVVIHAIGGFGDLLVSGRATPDIIKVSKRDPSVAHSELKATPSKASVSALNEPLERRNSDNSASLSPESAASLVHLGLALESYFKAPQDIEWCIDRENRLFLLQTRFLRTQHFRAIEPVECHFDEIQNKVIFSGGEAACAGIGAGKVYRIDIQADLDAVPKGAVLVSRNASPSFAKVMKQISAIITEKGSMAGHLASVAREFGVPALMNAKNALECLPQGAEVTVHTAKHTVYQGWVQSLMENPCAKRNLVEKSPFIQRLKYVIDFISPLRLIDPDSEFFKPDGCRSMHDIIRFCHEKAVREMFHISDRRIRKIRGSKKLKFDIPMLMYVLDVGGGLGEKTRDQTSVDIGEINSAPLLALLKGLSHPNIQWGNVLHFDWAEHDKTVLSGGIISPDSAMFASHATVSRDYANLNLKFGYHFVIVDALFDEQTEVNSILFRFNGGGADLSKRMLRAKFLVRILGALDFEVRQKSDLVDAEFTSTDRETAAEKLDMLGRLLGATRLMDMYLKDDAMVDRFVDDFMKEKYHFGKKDL